MAHITDADYERRARNIDDWARAQYAEGKMPEWQIERRVEAMFDALDADYGAHVPDPVQTRSDVDCEPDSYPGWHSLQSAARDAW